MNGFATLFRETKTAMFLIPFGIILIVFSVFFFMVSEHNKDFIKIEATVSKSELVSEATTDADGNREEAIYKIFVKYTVDGKDYDTELGEMNERKIGDKITIVYNPDNPKEISQPSSMILNVVLLVGGIITLGLGIVSIVAKKQQK